MPETRIELSYPSGHRQVWQRVSIASPPIDLYECVTFCPDGRAVEFRILNSKQLQRTIKRVRALGGIVTHHESPPPRDPAPAAGEPSR